MRVKEKTARKSKHSRPCQRPECGEEILPGQRYYSWEFRYGGARYRHVTCGVPPQSALTQSKISQVYEAVEGAEHLIDQINLDLTADKAQMAPDEIAEILGNVAAVAREVCEEYRQAAENFGGAGDNADRADELEAYADELEGWSANTEFPESDSESEAVDPTEEELSDYVGELAQEARDTLESLQL